MAKSKVKLGDSDESMLSYSVSTFIKWFGETGGDNMSCLVPLSILRFSADGERMRAERDKEGGGGGKLPPIQQPLDQIKLWFGSCDQTDFTTKSALAYSIDWPLPGGICFRFVGCLMSVCLRARSFTTIRTESCEAFKVINVRRKNWSNSGSILNMNVWMTYMCWSQIHHFLFHLLMLLIARCHGVIVYLQWS